MSRKPRKQQRVLETKKEVVRIFRYLLFGGAAFAIDVLVLWTCKTAIGMPAWLGSVLGFSVSTVFAFYSQLRYTFEARGAVASSIVRYLILLTFNLCVTALVVQAFDRMLDMYLIGKVIATGLTTCWNYFAMKLWVFAVSPSSK